MKFENKIKMTVAIGLMGAAANAVAQSTQAVIDNLRFSPRANYPTEQIPRNSSEVVNNLRGVDPASQTVPQFDSPQARGSVYQSLSQQSLSDETINSLTPGRTYVSPRSDIAVYGGWLQPSPPSQDGIPFGNLPAHIPEDWELDAYQGDQISKLIKESIAECRKTNDYGPRILCFEQAVRTIVAVSGDDGTQLAMRAMLSRAVDVVHHVMPFAGRNNAAIARAFCNFYENRFIDAIAFANNKARLCTNFEYLKSPTGTGLPALPEPVDGFKVSVLSFGRIFAEEMYEMSHDATFSVSAQAVALMRGIGYLGWDLASDRKWREPEVRQLMIKVYKLQRSPEYLEILASMSGEANGRSSEPRLIGSPVKKLNEKVFTILNEIKALAIVEKFRDSTSQIISPTIHENVLNELKALR
jgi:hypothetical protein